MFKQTHLGKDQNMSPSLDLAGNMWCQLHNLEPRKHNLCYSTLLRSASHPPPSQAKLGMGLKVFHQRYKSHMWSILPSDLAAWEMWIIYIIYLSNWSSFFLSEWPSRFHILGIIATGRISDLIFCSGWGCCYDRGGENFFCWATSDRHFLAKIMLDGLSHHLVVNIHTFVGVPHSSIVEELTHRLLFVESLFLALPSQNWKGQSIMCTVYIYIYTYTYLFILE